MEVKEPLKLSIKVLNNKKFRLSSEENKLKVKQEPTPVSSVPASMPSPAPSPLRPPLKLTLPKPATYPYSTSLTNDSKQDSKSWFVALDSSPHVKMKKEKGGELKVKLAKQPELPQRSQQSYNAVVTQSQSFSLRPFSTGFVFNISFSLVSFNYFNLYKMGGNLN